MWGDDVKKKKGILFSYLWKHKFSYLLGLFTLLIVDYVNLFIPQFTGEITDGLTSAALSIDGVIAIIMKILIAALIITIGRVLWRFFIFGSSRKIEYALRNDMFSKLVTLTQRYYNEHKTGDLMTHFTNDLEALRQSIGPAVISAFSYPVNFSTVKEKSLICFAVWDISSFLRLAVFLSKPFKIDLASLGGIKRSIKDSKCLGPFLFCFIKSSALICGQKFISSVLFFIP